MENFKSILETYEQLPEVGNIKKYFNKGIQEKLILESFAQFDITPTSELLELYQWHNGIYDCIWIFGSASFATLEDACTIYKLNLKIIASIEKTDQLADLNAVYRKELFPVFTDDDKLLVNVKSDSKNWGKIYIQNPAYQIATPMPIFNSLPDMFTTLISGFKKGIYSYENEYGGFSLNESDESLNHGNLLNPNCEYWMRMLENNVLNYEYNAE